MYSKKDILQKVFMIGVHCEHQSCLNVQTKACIGFAGILIFCGNSFRNVADTVSAKSHY